MTDLSSGLGSSLFITGGLNGMVCGFHVFVSREKNFGVGRGEREMRMGVGGE